MDKFVIIKEIVEFAIALLLAIYGIRAFYEWKKGIKVHDRIEKQKAAQKVWLSANKLILEVSLIRNRKPCSFDFERAAQAF